MKSPSAAVVAFVSALIGGLVGAGGAIYAGAGGAMPDELSVKSITADRITAKQVVADEVLSQDDTQGVLCRISKGSIQASHTITAGNLKAQSLIGKNVLLVSDPVGTDLKDHHIFIELAANPRTGGVIVIRNKDGVLIPAQGPVEKGHAIVMGFDQRALPTMYAHDISKGQEGFAHLIRSVVSTEPQAAATPQPEAAAGQ